MNSLSEYFMIKTTIQICNSYKYKIYIEIGSKILSTIIYGFLTKIEFYIKNRTLNRLA